MLVKPLELELTADYADARGYGIDHRIMTLEGAIRIPMKRTAGSVLIRVIRGLW